MHGRCDTEQRDGGDCGRSRSRSRPRRSICAETLNRSREDLSCPTVPCRPEDIKFGPDGFDFTAPEPMPKAAQERVQELLDSARLFRYQGGDNDVAQLEKEFASFVGVPYAMACNSGGCGLFLALKGLGVKGGDKVPGAVVHANAIPVFVKIDQETLSIDLEDLEATAVESGAKVLILSYMRGHLPNMDRILELVCRLKLSLVEDCAHTLGAQWRVTGEEEHRHIGTFGDVGVWSLQTNKSINCGEGGLVATKRQDVASIITISTGSYGHFALNGASGDVTHLQEIYPCVPNMSMRMMNLTAALARPQLVLLPERLKMWEQHAQVIRRALTRCRHTRIIEQKSFSSGQEILVWSSIQFELVHFTSAMVEDLRMSLAELGIPLAWFGGKWRGFTSTLKDWKFADPNGEQWQRTNAAALQSLVDLPLYHTASWHESVFEKLAALIVNAVNDVVAASASAE
eukprot:TRINITY_DN5132_c0_g2_i2.p1 TRINITY_DN5132_c0_g2~~TRINITY_DN5132_c0_g2_i2.p1  ORF type:complete len:458 (-),score=85.12 TRINITY_DN5132_c0_g2_i2:48-1421(-)